MKYAPRVFAILTVLVPALALPTAGAFEPAKSSGAQAAFNRAEQAVALVTDVQGEVQVLRPGERRAGTLHLVAALQPGALLTLAPGARVVLAFPRLGGVFAVQGNGRARIVSDRLEAVDTGVRVQRREMAAQMREMRIEPVRAAQASIVMRDGPRTGLAALAPSAMQLEAAAHSLRWQTVGAGWRYRVRLIDDAGHAVFESETDGSSVAVPASVTLQRGKPYVWTIDAIGANGRTQSAAAEFTVIDAELEDRVHNARAVLGTEFAERVAFAVALEQLGLLQEARAEWQVLEARRAQSGARAHAAELRPR